MARIQDFVNVQVLLKTGSIPPQGFGLELFLVDDPQIPVDVRFKYVDSDSYSDEFSSGSTPYDFAQVFFGQALKADELMIGRWIESASHPFFIWGPNYYSDYLLWKAVSDGSFSVLDNATPSPNEVQLTAIDFTAVTSFDDVLTVLNTELSLLVTPAITGLDGAEFKIDGAGRVVLEMPTIGASAAKIFIGEISPAVGTDLSVFFMDAEYGTSIEGFDAEDPQDALDAISDIDDSFYNVAMRGGTDEQKLDLASYIETKEKLLDLVTFDADTKDPLVTDDLASELKALTLKRTMIIYTEHTDQYPDAAIAGRILPTKEGTVNWAWKLVSLVTKSGLTLPLTIGERNALDDKNCNYFIDIKGNVTMYDGITSGNEEKRIMLGRDWFVARIRESIYTDMINDDLHAFDNETLTRVEQRIWEWADEAIDRRILVNTVDRPFTVTLPDADDIPPSERATHKLTVTDAFRGFLNSAINDYELIGTWEL